MNNRSNQEIEVRFLNINEKELKEKLRKLGAKDLGEDFLEEIIFYDKELKWHKNQGKFVRLRKQKGIVYLTYKHHYEESATGTEEIELTVSDMQQAKLFLESVGLAAFREQQKKRHSFELNNVVFDFDLWPQVPWYLEIEGPSEQSLKDAAALVGLHWKDAVFENPRKLIKKYYNIPVGDLKYFTFERIE